MRLLHSNFAIKNIHEEIMKLLVYYNMQGTIVFLLMYNNIQRNHYIITCVQQYTENHCILISLQQYAVKQLLLFELKICRVKLHPYLCATMYRGTIASLLLCNIKSLRVSSNTQETIAF